MFLNCFFCCWFIGGVGGWVIQIIEDSQSWNIQQHCEVHQWLLSIPSCCVACEDKHGGHAWKMGTPSHILCSPFASMDGRINVVVIVALFHYEVTDWITLICKNSHLPRLGNNSSRMGLLGLPCFFLKIVSRVGGFCFVTEEKSVFFSLLGASKSTESNGLTNLTYENFGP